MANKNSKLQYVIKSVPSESTLPLENLLNEMAQDGWELYSMSEIETDEGFQFNCIFVKEAEAENSFEDVVNITAFKSQMEKMLSAKLSPYETCRDIQAKIREKKKKIAKVKELLDKEEAGTPQRKTLNDKMSANIKELENLQQNLIRAISPDAMFSTLQLEKFSIHLSEQILEFVSPDSEADLLSETVKTRQKLADDLGYVIPKIVFKDDDMLAPYEFSINVRGLSVLSSFVYPKHLMYFKEDINYKGKKKDYFVDTDVITGKKVVWIPEEKSKDFWQKGMTPSEYIARAVEFVAIKYIDELLDYEDVNKYVDIVSEKNPYLVENIIPDFVSIAELRYIFVNLIREQVSIKDIVYVFEKINDYADEANKEALLDKIRYSLSRYITSRYASMDGIIQGLELTDKTMFDLFGETDDEDNIVRVDGDKVERVAVKLLKFAKENNLDNIILYVPMEIRHMTFIVLSQYINTLTVLAQEEVTNYYNFEIIGEV
ncbi:FHIPEP family type III secretion protein [bacterium]|nr:FHIPEP family type III secretion protein [bacterium]